MSQLLSPTALRELVIQAAEMTATAALVLPSESLKPLRMALANDTGDDHRVFRIFAWNMTHGGATRSDDEFRIQLTGALPDLVPGEETVVIGWSTKFGVFAGWDAAIHSGRTSNSPSLQVEREILTRARLEGIGAANRGSGDLVVAFRPELLTTYCLRSREIHSGTAGEIAAELNAIQLIDSTMGPSVSAGQGRQRMLRSFETNLRVWDFRKRVLSAYEQRCAICAQQLGLTEAAHIVPVAWPGSNDSTINGIALCRNHHRAYDTKLVSVTGSYVVEVSQAAFKRLRNQGESAGIDALLRYDQREMKVVPSRKDEQPDREYLELARVVRGWAG